MCLLAAAYARTTVTTATNTTAIHFAQRSRLLNIRTVRQMTNAANAAPRACRMVAMWLFYTQCRGGGRVELRLV